MRRGKTCEERDEHAIYVSGLISYMRAKDAVVHVRFIDDDEGQVAEQPLPLSVVGEQGLMEDVWVGQKYVGNVADAGTLVARSIAVQRRHVHWQHCRPPPTAAATTATTAATTTAAAAAAAAAAATTTTAAARWARANKFEQHSELVLRQRFGGKEVQRGGTRVLEHGAHHGHVVADALAGRSGCGHDAMAAAHDAVNGLCLVQV